MALTLETGTGLADADSFVSLAEVRAFAVSRGKSLPEVDATLEAQIRNAHDYLLTLEDRFKGYRRAGGQALPFPRDGLVVHNRLQPAGTIPQTLKNAVCQLVIELQTNELLAPIPDRVVTQEAIGPISTTYAVNGSSPSFPKVDAYLAPLLTSGSGLTTRRV